jgi:hypothetical protein
LDDQRRAAGFVHGLPLRGASVRFGRRHLIFSTTAGLAVAVAAVAVAARAVSGNPPDFHPNVYTNDLSHVPAGALSTSPTAALSLAEARLGGASEIRTAVAETPPPPHDVKGTWFHFVVNAPAADERSLHAQWETNLVAGAVADALARSHLGAPVTGTTIDVRLPDGTVLSGQGGGMGDIAHGQQFSEPSDADLLAAIKSGLQDTGLNLIRFGVLHVEQPAPDVVVQTNDPQATARAASSLISALFLTSSHTPLYEGYYFEVEDSDRNPVLIATTSFRTGGGSLWFSPRIADALSLQHG